jgi:phage-related protein (TIGR01555 family)
MYTGNGIFQTAIQLPIQDAISKGFEIDSGELDAENIEKVLEWWEENDMWDLVLNAFTWTRLYGGGAIIINTNQNPEKPLNYNILEGRPLEFYDVDRWQIDNQNANFKDDNYRRFTDQEFYYLYGQKIHKSRVIRIRGKKAPSYVSQNLRGWGMSEGERMIRAINLNLKTEDVLYEIVDESKVDVYKIEGLANKLLTTGGTTHITKRIQAANEIKSYVNALVLDSEEEFEQKNMSFAGVAEIMQQNRINVASAVKMPLTKLFGLSASGFNTGESDLENYNNNVESDIRRPLKPIIRKLLNVGFSHLFGYQPSFKISFPALRELSAVDEESIKSSQTNRALAIYDRGLYTSEEFGQAGKKEGWIEIDTMAEQGKLPDYPAPPNGSEGIDPASITVDPKDPASTKGKTGAW